MRFERADEIRRITQNRLEVIRYSTGRWDFISSLKSLNEETAHEYENRFVFELLQNAYDVQPEGTHTGRVCCLLDVDAEGHATLYVANTGMPFYLDNVEALTNLAQSTKPPGEGIGNKGLGFRSVLQLCDWPEVFSTGADGRAESGYCFAFARRDDLRALALDDTEFQSLNALVHPSLLPVPCTAVDDVVSDLLAEGYATVIRLPLRDARALTVAQSRLHALRETPSPVLLFLDRLASVEVRYRGMDADGFTLERTAAPADIAIGGSVRTHFVSTAGKDYVTVARSVDRDAVMAAIEADVAAGYLAEAWLDWQGDAEVVVALEVRGHLTRGSFYTYMPTDEPAPLPAHINAPFYTKLGRTHLSFETALNERLLSSVAELCVDAARGMSGHADPWRAIFADLLSWDGEHAPRLGAALRRTGDTTPLIAPALSGRKAGWAPLSDVTVWPGELGDRYFSATALAAGRALVPLDPQLGSERLDRFARAPATRWERT